MAFLSTFKCSWQHLLCCSGGWRENLSLCTLCAYVPCAPCAHGVGNCGSVERWKWVYRGGHLPPHFLVFHDLALSSSSGSSMVQ